MCQIDTLNDMACEAPFTLKAEQFLWTTLRKLRIIQFMIKFKQNSTKKKISRINDSNNSPNSEANLQNHKGSVKNNLKERSNQNIKILEVGDLVRIRSKVEILQTLDKDNKTKGCGFMDEMWQYCGTKHKIIKKIEYFYDECNQVMRKAHNTVLLEDLRCSGNKKWKHNCDRFCYYFWRGEWLEKIEDK
jgi:hypothetical protein